MERRTGEYTKKYARTWQGALGVLLAGGVLLTGCSGTPAGNKTSADGRRDGPLPAPAPAASGGAADSEGAKKRDGLRESAPPDYLSTFALDVDTASYGYARRTLGDGGLPDPSTVRPEEFVNSFRQGYRRPDGNGFTVNVDGARAGAKGDDWSLVRVGLATRAAPARDERPPAALTFVVDISGSMAETGRLDLVKKSLDILTDELRDDDSVSLVTFSDEAKTLLPMTRLQGHRGRIRDRVPAQQGARGVRGRRRRRGPRGVRVPLEPAPPGQDAPVPRRVRPAGRGRGGVLGLSGGPAPSAQKSNLSMLPRSNTVGLPRTTSMPRVGSSMTSTDGPVASHSVAACTARRSIRPRTRRGWRPMKMFSAIDRSGKRAGSW